MHLLDASVYINIRKPFFLSAHYSYWVKMKIYFIVLWCTPKDYEFIYETTIAWCLLKYMLVNCFLFLHCRIIQNVTKMMAANIINFFQRKNCILELSESNFQYSKLYTQNDGNRLCLNTYGLPWRRRKDMCIRCLSYMPCIQEEV